MRTPPDHAYPDHWEADVVLRDGGAAHIRPITAADAERLVSFYEQVSDESKYYRFFAPYPRLSARDVHRFTHHDYVDRVGLAATVGDEFIATVRYDRIDAAGRPAPAPADQAEVAFLVQDAHQGRGLASALLEHIAAVARERGIRRFVAEVLPANNKMIKVFTDAGYTQKRSFEDGSVHLTLDLEPTARSLAVQRAREQRAEARSVRRLLAPGSIAVVGVGRASGGVGRTVLRNLLASGYTGRTYAVNRAFPEDWTEADGVPAFRSVGEIVERAGERVDLAVVAVPAERVPDVIADCGENGVQGLVVVTAGYAESGPDGRERQRELVRQARSYGMRVIGPNSFGIISTAPAVQLNASLAPHSPARGRIGLFTQSGAIGIALLSGLHRRGAGLSAFISSGNRADVSGNDFLQYWHEDPDTDVVLLYLESIGNPRKFTRLARRTAAVKPVVVVKGARHSGSAPPGHAVPVTRIPDATVSALLRQAGVIRVDTVTELIDAGLLLADQPLPAGPRVAILGNSESLGLLTYDACLTEGLRPLPPRDLTTAATPAGFRAALAEALADDACDAVVVTAIPWVAEDGVTESGDGEVLAAALQDAASASPAKPVAVVHVELGGLAEALAAAAGTAGPHGGPPTEAYETGERPGPAADAGPGTTGDARAAAPGGGPGMRAGDAGESVPAAQGSLRTEGHTGPWRAGAAGGGSSAPGAGHAGDPAAPSPEAGHAPGGGRPLPVSGPARAAGPDHAGDPAGPAAGEVPAPGVGNSPEPAGPVAGESPAPGADAARGGGGAAPGSGPSRAADPEPGPDHAGVPAGPGAGVRAEGAGPVAGEVPASGVGRGSESVGPVAGESSAPGSGQAVPGSGPARAAGPGVGVEGAAPVAGQGPMPGVGHSPEAAGPTAGETPAPGAGQGVPGGVSARAAGPGGRAEAGAPDAGEASGSGDADAYGPVAGARAAIPAFPAAERAVRALAEAVRYAQWRRQAADPGRVPEYDDIDEQGAAALIAAALGQDADPRGMALAPQDAHAVLARYGIPVLPALPAPTPDAAVAAAERLGYPVALKTTAPHLRHRPDLGGVRLDLTGEAQLRRAYAELTAALGKPEELQPVVQAMAPRGVDTVVRAAIDPAVGAVLSFGLAGAASELLGDTAHRLVPVTDRDAAELIRTIRTAPLLFGWRGSAPVDTPALEELLQRVSRLVDDHPEVVGVSLEPVAVAQRGLSVLGASVRLAPPPARTDLGPRRLPSY